MQITHPLNPPQIPPVLTFAEAAKAMGAAIFGDASEVLQRPLDCVSTDTRTMQEGALLFALIGERFDAHDYLSENLIERAGAIVVSRDPATLPPLHNNLLLLVKDTVHALGLLATAWAQRCAEIHRQTHAVSPVRIALCGSSGKTTTKEMLSDILADAVISAQSTPGNLNNLIGLPLTMLGLTPTHRAAVLELGMNLPGEARDLVRIAQPTTLLLTNINNAHVGMFGTLEDLYRAECDSLIHAPANTTFVMNHDDPSSQRARQEHAAGHPLVCFSTQSSNEGRDQPHWRAEDIEPLVPFGYRFALICSETRERRTVELRVFGRHNVGNAVAAAAIASDPRCGIGLPLDQVAQSLSRFQPRLNRSEIELCQGWWIIKDFYNAVPAAVEAALRAMADVHVPGRRLALLSEMRELGDLHEECHLSVGRAAAAATLDHLVTIGDRARPIHEEARRSGLTHATHFDTKDEATRFLKETLQPGDLLLLKGARLVGLETVYEALTGRHALVH